MQKFDLADATSQPLNKTFALTHMLWSSGCSCCLGIVHMTRRSPRRRYDRVAPQCKLGVGVCHLRRWPDDRNGASWCRWLYSSSSPDLTHASRVADQNRPSMGRHCRRYNPPRRTPVPLPVGSSFPAHRMDLVSLAFFCPADSVLQSFIFWSSDRHSLKAS